MCADPAFRARYGPVALVAGGSEGLGAEFARQLAARGLDLLLIADGAEALAARARELESRYAVGVRTSALDLGARDAPERVADAARGLEVGLMVYNAAHAPIGRFLDRDAADVERCIDVNCRGPLRLAHACGREMAARGRGGIVLLSSLAAFQGAPYTAAYAASKAFNLVLGESLHAELRGAGVDVLALCPGATRTPGWARSRPAHAGRFAAPLMEPADVVVEALAALGRRPSAIAGRANRATAVLLQRLLPRRVSVSIMERALRALYRDRV